MSLYNMINGVKPTTFFALPLIGEGHHPDEFPRFRDCFIGDDEHPEFKDHIIVYTRTGGGNRESYESENNWITSLSGYVSDYDDSFDSTFACWVFRPDSKWEADFEKLLTGKLTDASPEYQERVRKVFPKLKEQFDQLWPTVAASVRN